MRRTLDILGLMIILSTPVISTMASGRFNQSYVQIIMILICGAYSFLFIDKLKAYFIRIVLATTLSCALVTAIFGAAHGYILIFYLVICKWIIVGAISGYFVAYIIDIALQRFGLLNKNKNVIVIGLILFSSSLIMWGISSNVTESHSLDSALSNRDELIGKIVRFVTKDNKSIFTNKNIIEQGYLDNLYSYDSRNKIIHEFAGEIEINANGDDLIITYKEMPAEKPCYLFYSMNSPEYLGFSTITVDGKSIKTDTNAHDMEQKKNELCFSGQNKVEISYTAKIDRIKEIANW